MSTVISLLKKVEEQRKRRFSAAANADPTGSADVESLLKRIRIFITSIIFISLITFTVAIVSLVIAVNSGRTRASKNSAALELAVKRQAQIISKLEKDVAAQSKSIQNLTASKNSMTERVRQLEKRR